MTETLEPPTKDASTAVAEPDAKASGKRSSILAKLRQKHSARGRVEIPLLPRTGGGYPLSNNQQRLWFIEQLHPDTGIYNIGLTVRMSGRLDYRALARALNGVTARHEALRTYFGSRDGEPFQEVLPRVRLQVPYVDLTRGGFDERGIVPLVARFRRRSFDLHRAPLMRVAVLRLAPDLHVMVLSQHHLITDGWSMSVLIQEVLALYRQEVEGVPAALPPLELGHVDVAAWSRTALDEAEITRLLDFWRAHLEGSPGLLELPGDRPRPAVQSHRGDILPLRLSESLSERMRATSRDRGTTLFVTTLAAFQCALYLWSQQEDLVIGLPIATRGSSALKQLIGFLTNTLAVRVQIDAETRLGELQSRVHELILEAHRHQSVPFDRLVDSLKPERSLAHTPLFQVAFAFQNAPMPRLELPQLTLEPLPISAGTTLFDVVTNIEEAGESLGGWIEYSTDLFDRTTLQRFVRCFVHMLEALVEHPEGRVSEVSRMDAAERHQLLWEWNDTRRIPTPPPAADETLHGLIAAQARTTPNADAVIFGDAGLTYAELDRRAAHLARRLADASVGPEDRVGVAMLRSLEMMVAIVATLKAGAAYVPLEPSYPAERLAFMAGDADLAAVLTVPALAADLPLPEDVPVLHVNASEELPEESAEPAAPALARGDSAAYLIYTSGSTGRPKAVAVHHAGVINRVRRMDERYPFGPGERLLQKTPFSFDVSAWELFSTLTTGAALVMAAPDEHRDPAALARSVERHGITAMHFVPSMLDVFLEQPDLEGLTASLRRVFVSGEALSDALAERFFRRLGLPLENLYGPTEASVDVTHWAGRPPAAHAEPEPVTLGRPIGGIAIHILDATARPVGIGVAGELHIAGIGVARGYRGRPALTAERFVPSPFPTSAAGGERLYRSGDLARRRRDGEIEFLGRLDFQVKVRGFRIELGEIEGRLREHPEVREAVVTAWGEQASEQRLVAYVLAEEGAAAPDLEALRPFLLEKLPEYMVPSLLVPLESLPLTSSGKLDRKALPAPSVEGPRGNFVAPRNRIEEDIADLWCTLLGLPRVSVHDNFFQLGGHSLLAPRLLSRVSGLFDVDLSLGQLFQSPTVAGLADRVATVRGGDGASREAGPVPGERPEHLPLSFPQERFWIRRPSEGASAMSNTFSGIRLRGPLDARALHRGLAWIVDRHEALRTAFYRHEGGVYQRVRTAAPVPFPRVDLRALPRAAREPELKRVAAAFAARTFDLAEDLLIRFALVTLGRASEGAGAADENALLVVQDHLTADGWSGSVFAHELADAYHDLTRGREPARPPLPVQYADYALWQRRRFAERGEELRRYWLDLLDHGDFPVLSLPVDFPPASRRELKGAVRTLLLDRPVSEALIDLGRREHASLFITLLAAAKAFLRQWTGQSDLPLTTNIAHRDRVEIEPLIGVFTNVLVLRTDLMGDLSFRQVLSRVRRSTLAAYTHQDYPFSDLLGELAPGRAAGLNELFPVAFVLEEMPLPPLSLSQLEVEPLRLAKGALSRDLLFRVTPRDGRLQIDLHFRTDLFRDETMDQAADLLRKLLEAAVAEPDRPLSGLPLDGSAALSPAGRLGRVLSAANAPVSTTMGEKVADTLAAAATHPVPVPRSAHLGNAASFNYGWLTLAGGSRLCIYDHTLHGVDDIYVPWALLGDGGRVKACFDARGLPMPEMVGKHASVLRDAVPHRHRSILNFDLEAEVDGEDLIASHMGASRRLAEQLCGIPAEPWSAEVCRLEEVMRPVVEDFAARRLLHYLFDRWVLTSSKGLTSMQKIVRFDYAPGGEVAVCTNQGKVRFRGSGWELADQMFRDLAKVRDRLLAGATLGKVGYPWFTNPFSLFTHALEAYRAAPGRRVFLHAVGTMNHLYVRQAEFLRTTQGLIEALTEGGHLPRDLDLRLIPTLGTQLFACGPEGLAVLDGMVGAWREKLRRLGARGKEWITAMAGTGTPARVVSAFASELDSAYLRDLRGAVRRFNEVDVNYLPYAYMMGLHHPRYAKYGTSQRSFLGHEVLPASELTEMRWVETELLVRLLAHLTLDEEG